jgi:extracellular factor (EF) 3-hydroxypalmitic acid methyl ester biosynthesis protein
VRILDLGFGILDSTSGERVSAVVKRAAASLCERLIAVESQLEAPHDADAVYRQVEAALDDCLAELRTTGLWGVENRLPSSELWNAVGEILCRGWLQNQARIKPRGYAGDYEMLSRIYEGRLCDDPLGRLFDRYFQDQAAPQAVQNRMRMMADWIVDAVQGHAKTNLPLKVAVIGSAFGSDIRDAVNRLSTTERQRLEVTLLDMDPAALGYAREQLEGLLPADRLRTVTTNVFRLYERPRLAEPLAATDLLMCPGLFDYLDDGQAANLLRVFWQQLAPGGCLSVFQFAPHNPTRAYMEWLGNWYLVYRVANQLRSLAIDAGIPPTACMLGAEPLGVDLLLSASRE